jgi:hypothetical protein
MLSLFRRNRKPYLGGPRFDNHTSKSFQMEEWELSVKYPDGGDTDENIPKPANFAFRSGDLMSIDFHRWCFHGRLRVRLEQIMVGDCDPIAEGILWIWVRELVKDKRLDLKDPNALGEYIKWEYHDRLETPGGDNYKRRKEEERKFAGTYEYDRRKRDAWMRYLSPVPENVELRTFEEREWTRYTLKNRWDLADSHYVTPLDERHYLQFHFDYRIERLGWPHQDALLEAMHPIEHWMMPRVKLQAVMPHDGLDTPQLKPRQEPSEG